jgi:hypothetical protein
LAWATFPPSLAAEDFSKESSDVLFCYQPRISLDLTGARPVPGVKIVSVLPPQMSAPICLAGCQPQRGPDLVRDNTRVIS